jgi:hypothetical protein
LSRINQQTGEAAWSAERIREWSSFAKKRRVVPTPSSDILRTVSLLLSHLF